MAFHFERHEPVGGGMERILRERLECAIERFAESVHPTDPVHAVRKDLKKIRAILWLLRSQMRNTAYRREADALRELSNLLGPVRDTQVHLQTLENLKNDFKGGREESSFAIAHSLLKCELNGAQETFASKQEDRRAVKLLQAAKSRIADIKAESLADEWETLSCGILETYKRGRNGLLLARKEGRSEDYHEWRKAVKRLWYQVRLIAPAWPSVLETLNDNLGRLGEGLGVDHDLFVLQKILEKQSASALSPRERRWLVTFISERQMELRGEYLWLGQRVYCEKPTEFCKRIGCYWQKWRSEPG